MWQYLSTPENSYVTWKLVGTQWGHGDYSSIVQAQQFTHTYAYLQDNEFKALASVNRGGAMETGWLNIWSSGRCNIRVWQELYDYLFKDLGIEVLLAITSRKGLIRYAEATHGHLLGTASNWFGPGQPAYILQWE